MATGRPVEITRAEQTATDLRRAAARSREADAGARSKGRKQIAEGCDMDRQTPRDWVTRYNAEGLTGLPDQVPPGPTFLLEPEQIAELAVTVEAFPDPAVDQVVRWRRVDLRRFIGERWGVEFHERPMSKPLHRYAHSQGL